MLDRFWRKLERNWSIILSFLFMRMSTFDIFPAFNYQLTCFLASFTKWCIWADLHLILCLKSEFYVALLESTRLFFLKNKTKQKKIALAACWALVTLIPLLPAFLDRFSHFLLLCWLAPQYILLSSVLGCQATNAKVGASGDQFLRTWVFWKPVSSLTTHPQSLKQALCKPNQADH